MFDISFKKTPFINEWGEKSILANITINDFSEDFHIPISYWNKSDYMNSWKESIEKGVFCGKDSILYVSMYPINTLTFLQSWILYFLDDCTKIQNTILFKEDFENEMDLVSYFVPERMGFSDDGMVISEWTVELQSIIDFYNRLKYENTVR